MLHAKVLFDDGQRSIGKASVDFCFKFFELGREVVGFCQLLTSVVISGDHRSRNLSFYFQLSHLAKMETSCAMWMTWLSMLYVGYALINRAGRENTYHKWITGGDHSLFYFSLNFSYIFVEFLTCLLISTDGTQSLVCHLIGASRVWSR